MHERDKLLNLGRSQGRREEQANTLALLEEIAASPEVGKALASAITELKSEGLPQAGRRSTLRTGKDLGDRMCDAMGLPPAPEGAAEPPRDRRASSETKDLGDRMVDAMGLPPLKGRHDT